MLVLLAIVATMVVNYGFEKGLKLKLNWPIKLALTPTCLLAVWVFAPDGAPFIYFDF